MGTTTLHRLTISVALAALVAGCGGAATSLPAPQAVSDTAAKFDSSGSWMLPDAVSRDLLYVSDAHGAVYVFSYPDGKAVGVLRGFQSPAGICSDRFGNVYIVNTNAVEVLVYKHGGTKPIKALDTFGYYPFGCAVNPANGDVAVANFSSQAQGPGAVSIFHSGKGFPSNYSDTAINAYFFVSYDNHSNLYVDGADYGSYHTLFAELPKGATQFKAITLDETIHYPGGVQWDGSAMAIQDTTSRILYRFKLEGSQGKALSSTRFAENHSTLVHQFWIDGSTIVMPYGTVARLVRRVGFWHYPAGGALQKSFGITKASELVGVTISVAPR